MADTARRGPGRPADGGDRRALILAAAREEFAGKGYAAASVRGIARSAEVDPALVHHYFGTKEQVFVAAMELPFAPAELVPQILDGPRGRARRAAGAHVPRCLGSARTSGPRCSACCGRR